MTHSVVRRQHVFLTTVSAVSYDTECRNIGGLDTIREVFKNNLKRLRGSRTQAAIAELAGIPLRSYQRSENGVIPQAPHLAAIARAIGVPEVALFQTLITEDMIRAIVPVMPPKAPKPPDPTPKQALKILAEFVRKHGR